MAALAKRNMQRLTKTVTIASVIGDTPNYFFTSSNKNKNVEILNLETILHHFYCFLYFFCDV